MGISSGRIVNRAGNKRLGIGNENFAQVMTEATYVDKSLLARELIEGNHSAILFCRPRRFGKSLAMRMLQCFFEVPVDGPRGIPERSGLFEGLAVLDAGEEVLSHMGAHPVIYLSLGEVFGKCWNDALGSIEEAVSVEYDRHSYVLESARVPEADKAAFRRIVNKTSTRPELYSSLARLSRMLHNYHGAGSVILIDEYDRPVTLGHLRGFRDEAIEFTRTWLTGALKATDVLFRACMTGVQRVSRESIFSGLNNITVNTTLNASYTEAFGFTAAEAEELARHMGLEDSIGDMREWYDGYHFGKERVYNPWSVLNFIDQHGVTQPYWGNTSDNAIVHELFRQASGATAEDLARLASGEHVVHPLDLATAFDMVDRDPETIWSQLYLAGYVTCDDVDFPNDSERERELRVPNREVAHLYRDEFAARSLATAGGRPALRALHKALVSGNADALASSLRRILLDSPAALDLVTENSYHMLVLGLLYSVYGYRFPVSNREAGDGRADVLLAPENENKGKLPSILIEVKATKDADADELDALAEKALAQIESRSYASVLPSGPHVSWGIAFSGKHAACRKAG